MLLVKSEENSVEIPSNSANSSELVLGRSNPCGSIEAPHLEGLAPFDELRSDVQHELN